MIKIISRILLAFMLIGFFVMCLMGCQLTSSLKDINTRLINIQTGLSKLDSTYRYNQTQIINYEKGKSQIIFHSMPTDSLLKYIRSGNN
ncbi:hypothetical protein [Emticicia sp.]|uniref:hypothetical protein n=1 Tax=Emticicia sp. TaxID=1930953 RepID=UPI003753443A